MSIISALTKLVTRPLIPSLLVLSACNGTEPAAQLTPMPVSTPALEPEPDVNTLTVGVGTSNLTSVVLNPSGTGSVSSSAGLLDYTQNTAGIAGLQGTLNDARTILTIATGGQVTLTPPSSAEFSARFRADPVTGADTTGIVGIPTFVANMPTSGSAALTGSANVTAFVGQDRYDLAGSASTDVVFGASGTVTTILSNLSGQYSPNQSSSQQVSNIGSVTLSNAAISGNTFSGGTVTTSGTALEITGSQTLSQSGQFFGPDAVEAGGVFVINDTAAGTTRILGDFIVD